jgi:hypothetical protein
MVRKGTKNAILQKMNSFDLFLKFTVVEMQENKLIYLDTKISEKNDTLELEQYRKILMILQCSNYMYYEL